jgi:hypothetical protein
MSGFEFCRRGTRVFIEDVNRPDAAKYGLTIADVQLRLHLASKA